MGEVTKGPWYVRDLRASEMKRLGWTGPSIDRILITNKTGPEIIRDEGDNCVVARIQFDNRPENLGENNLADAYLIAAAPDLYEALEDLERAIAMERAGVESDLDGWMDAFDSVEACRERAHAALAKAKGQGHG